MPQTFAKSLRDDDDTRELPLDWFDRQQEFQIKFDGVRPADPDRAAVHQQVFGPSSDPDKTAKHFLELLCKAQVADEPPPLKRKHEEVVMSPKKAKINSSEDSPAKKIKDPKYVMKQDQLKNMITNGKNFVAKKEQELEPDTDIKRWKTILRDTMCRL